MSAVCCCDLLAVSVSYAAERELQTAPPTILLVCICVRASVSLTLRVRVTVCVQGSSEATAAATAVSKSSSFKSGFYECAVRFSGADFMRIISLKAQPSVKFQ